METPAAAPARVTRPDGPLSRSVASRTPSAPARPETAAPQRRSGITMRQRNVIIGLTVLAAGATGWYLFRPERLFIDDVVAEAFPGEGTAAASAAPPTALASGMFHSNAHETRG